MAKKMDGINSKSGKNMAMKKTIKPIAMKKSIKPIEQKSLQRTTKKLFDSQRIEKRPLDTSVPSKKDMIRRVNTKMAENAYDAGILRYNIGGQDNPTPYPRVEASKKSKMTSRIVSKLKKK